MTFDANNIQQLLRYALQERNSEAVVQLLLFMQHEPAIYPIVTDHLHDWLTTEPDAVYFFGRTALAQGFDEKWLPLLGEATRASLQIVIEQGDSESIMEWLRLIVREPATYQLNDILREGIGLAQIRAHDDGVLGGRLLLFALKRASDLVTTMMTDKAFVSALTPPIGIALQTFQAYAIKESIEAGRDFGLLALAQALKSAPTNPDAANVFTPDIIHYLWILHAENDTFAYLTDTLKPVTLIAQLVDASTTWLSDEGIQSLLTYTISDPDSSFFADLCQALAQDDREAFLSRLNHFYIKLQHPPEIIIPSINQLQEMTILSPQEATQIYYQLGGAYDWKNAKGKVYLEQLGRLFQQNSAVQLPLDALRKVHKLAGELRLELIQKTFLKRIQAHLDAQTDDAPPLDLILELQEALQWSNNLQNQFLSWWRAYALNQPLTRLQFIEKSFETKRALEGLRAVLQTTIALRKFLGKRSLDEVASALNTAFSLMQLLSDAFDPLNNRPLHFDSATFQMEMTHRAEELTPRERSVLAKDLRELADLITEMADYRSKSTLIRREDDIERQLMTGEQDPQSAIDTMRWLSGLLGRMQSGG
ncbi:MAG: hypothetical protein SH821_05010 [Phototrophicales bacterium]|nr:hypothetical protein [Phototrophicales bacterium]